MVRRILLVLSIPLLLAVGLFVYLWMSFVVPDGPVELVSFTADDGVVLVGDLYLPEGDAPHAAMIVMHGSGPEVMSDVAYRMHAVAFAREGIAVLMWDKRGAGRSEGDFDAATFQNFMNDGYAALEYLRTRSDIDPNRIGLLGFSEGAWFTPEMAVRDGNIAFIVNRVMPATDWAETNIYENQIELRQAGADEATIARAVDLRRRIWEYYRDAVAANDPLATRRAALEAEVDAIRSEDWYGEWRMGVGEYDPEVYRTWLADIFYDPAPWIAQVDVPLFAVFAMSDQNIPSARSIEILNDLTQAHNLDARIETYAGRRHSMLRAQDIMTAGFPPDYLPSISQWAAEQVAE